MFVIVKKATCLCFGDTRNEHVCMYMCVCVRACACLSLIVWATFTFSYTIIARTFWLGFRVKGLE